MLLVSSFARYKSVQLLSLIGIHYVLQDLLTLFIAKISSRDYAETQKLWQMISTIQLSSDVDQIWTILFAVLVIYYVCLCSFNLICNWH